MFKDKSGRDVTAGDLIIYSTSSKYEDNMHYGIVLEVQPDSLIVRGAYANYKGEYVGKKVEIYYEVRVLILERHQIPYPIIDLFDAVVVSEPKGLASESPDKMSSITTNDEGFKATWVSDAPEIRAI